MILTELRDLDGKDHFGKRDFLASKQGQKNPCLDSFREESFTSSRDLLLNMIVYFAFRDP